MYTIVLSEVQYYVGIISNIIIDDLGSDGYTIDVRTE